MAKVAKSQRKAGAGPIETAKPAHGIPKIAAPALLSFIKQVSAEASWDGSALAQVLKIKPPDAPQIIATLEMLGYAEPLPGKDHSWRNTESGNAVSGAKPPRFNRESVLEALDDLRSRAAQMNADPASPYRITDLIAFGDFLDERPKVQAADVGVGLAPKERPSTEPSTAIEHKHEERVIADLKAKSALMHLHLIEDWMHARSHSDLLASRNSTSGR